MRAVEVVREAWLLYKAHWRHLLPIAFVVYLLLSLFTFALVVLAGWIGLLAVPLVTLAGLFWMQGALVLAVADIRDGRADVSIRETVSSVQPRLNTLGLTGLLAAIGIAIGLQLVLVPGLVLLTWWALVVPVIMLEGASVLRAFKRSRALVRGYGFSVFGGVVLTLLVLLAAVFGLVAVLSALPDTLASYVAPLAVNTVGAPFVALVSTVAYYRLRDARRPDHATTDVSPTGEASTFGA